jgi:hypothetical protein
VLTLRPAWKGADPDISILKQAKVEDARALLPNGQSLNCDDAIP